MRKKIIILVVVVISILVIAIASRINLKSVPKCSANLDQGQVCYVNNLTGIHAGQFNYGEQYVKAWVEKYKALPPAAYQETVLDNNPRPIVIAPNGTIYLVDGHHRSRATEQLSQIQHHQYRMYMQVFKKFPQSQSPQAMNDFWNWIISTKNIWLEDNGVYRDKNDIPKQVDDITNDKYRSLTGWLKEAGWCYKDAALNYHEFYWADYFRHLAQQGIIKDYPDPDVTTEQGKKAEQDYLNYIKQTGVCHAKTAEELPGYCHDNNC